MISTKKKERKLRIETILNAFNIEQKKYLSLERIRLFRCRQRVFFFIGMPIHSTRYKGGIYQLSNRIAPIVTLATSQVPDFYVRQTVSSSFWEHHTVKIS